MNDRATTVKVDSGSETTSAALKNASCPKRLPTSLWTSAHGKKNFGQDRILRRTVGVSNMATEYFLELINSMQLLRP